MIELLSKKIDRAARGVAMAQTEEHPQQLLAIVAAELEDLREMARAMAGYGPADPKEAGNG